VWECRRERRYCSCSLMTSALDRVSGQCHVLSSLQICNTAFTTSLDNHFVCLREIHFCTFIIQRLFYLKTCALCKYFFLLWWGKTACFFISALVVSLVSGLSHGSVEYCCLKVLNDNSWKKVIKTVLVLSVSLLLKWNDRNTKLPPWTYLNHNWIEVSDLWLNVWQKG
jgi:hypothetical protein